MFVALFTWPGLEISLCCRGSRDVLNLGTETGVLLWVLLSQQEHPYLALPRTSPTLTQHLQIFKNTQSLAVPMGSRHLQPPAYTSVWCSHPRWHHCPCYCETQALPTSPMPTTATHNSCTIKSCSYPPWNTLRVMITFLEPAWEDQLGLEQLQTAQESQMRLRPPTGSWLPQGNLDQVLSKSQVCFAWKKMFQDYFSSPITSSESPDLIGCEDGHSRDLELGEL